jgi:hypothetical protein
MMAITVSALVATTIGMVNAFLHLGALFVRIVWCSQLGKEVSSIDNRFPMLSERSKHPFACGF